MERQQPRPEPKKPNQINREWNVAHAQNGTRINGGMMIDGIIRLPKPKKPKNSA